MLEQRTFRGTEAEKNAVTELVASLGDFDGHASVTRTEAGDTGPLRVEAAGRSWIVREDGTTEEEA